MSALFTSGSLVAALYVIRVQQKQIADAEKTTAENTKLLKAQVAEMARVAEINGLAAYVQFCLVNQHVIKDANEPLLERAKRAAEKIRVLTKFE